MRGFKDITPYEILTTILISLAVFVLGFHIWEANRNIPYLLIESPIPITNQSDEPFTLDSELELVLKGRRFRDSAPSITRALVCDNQRVRLTTITGDDIITRAGAIDTSARLTLNDVLKDRVVKPKSDTNCKIEFESIDAYNLPLGGTRDLVHIYFTQLFDLQVSE